MDKSFAQIKNKKSPIEFKGAGYYRWSAKDNHYFLSTKNKSAAVEMHEDGIEHVYVDEKCYAEKQRYLLQIL